MRPSLDSPVDLGSPITSRLVDRVQIGTYEFAVVF